MVADEPESFGGTGQGPFALRSAAGCPRRLHGDDRADVRPAQKWALEEAVVRLRHEKIHAEDCVHCEEKERKIDRFERELELRGNLDEEQRRRLVEIAERCPVHRTLNSEVLIETRLREEEEG
jgi:putative redox protein